MYTKDDKVVFQINDTTLEYYVVNVANNRWFLSIRDTLNDVIFKKLHINDKESFVVMTSKCNLTHYRGSFPVIICDDASGINRVIDALQQKCAEMSGQSKTSSKPAVTSQYKKGDVVRIISKDQIRNRNNYRFYFNFGMDQYCDHNYIIDEIRIPQPGPFDEYLLPDDGMLYRLKDTDGKILPYNFSSSMFESKLVLPQVADKPIRQPDTDVCTEANVNPHMYKKGDKVTFYIDDDDFTYVVLCNNGCWWLGNCDGSNSEIFEKLYIDDRFKFVSKISKHMSSKTDVGFPEVYCTDETEINKVIDALLKECDEYNRHNRREIPYVPEQCKHLDFKINLGKPKNKYQLKFTN